MEKLLRSLNTRLDRQRTAHKGRNPVIRVAFLLLGLCLLLSGLILLVLPGPGVLLIAGGVGILSLEFAFLERLLARISPRETNQLPPGRSDQDTHLSR